MKEIKLIESLAEANGGILTTEEVVRNGISKTTLANFVKKNNYERISPGIYLAPNAWKDDAYILQLRCPQIIFSHDSALYFHDLTDREPLHSVVTLKTGYNPSNLSNRGIKVFTIKKELFNIGLSLGVTPLNHQVRVYDLERTICDIVRSRNVMDSQIFYDALKQYVRKKEKNLQKLMEYAYIFHVEKLLRQYMEVLL